MLDTGHCGLGYSLDGQLDALLQGRTLDYVFLSHPEIARTGNLGRLLAAAVSARPALPFTGLRQRDQKARVAAFRNLMKAFPIEIITSGHSGPVMGPALEPAIEKLLTAVATSPPRFLQSGVAADLPGMSQRPRRGADPAQ